jgi:hypothetical protein
MDRDKFRSYRDRDPVAREAPEQTSRGEIGDLLVELARLTGQGDPYANVSRDGGSTGLDWAADDSAGADSVGVCVWSRITAELESPREQCVRIKPP